MVAQIHLLSAQVSVWTTSRGTLLKPVSPVSPSQADLETAARWARAISRAASYGIFRPRCLVRALALQRLLTRRGIRGAQLRLGVRVSGNEFAAHAWVVLGDEPLGESSESLKRYHALPSVGSDIGS